LIGACLSIPVQQKQLTHHQIVQLSHLMRTLESKKYDVEKKADHVKHAKNTLPVGKGIDIFTKE
ncbi:MAG: hypothetical protein AAFO91_20205, partial [Bacteroidota bacterium]